MAKVKMNITLEDYIKKGKYVFYHSSFFRILLIVLIATIAFLFWKGVLQKQPSAMDVLGAVLLYVIIIIFFLRFTRRIYLSYLSLDKELFPLAQELSIDEEGVRGKSDDYDLFVNWSQITSVSEVEKYLFFKRRKASLFVLYKELITKEELASIREELIKLKKL